ncbi:MULTISPECIES: flagellar assembly protein FliH [Marinobacter]|jgi:flagellar assembly protein FliH|uniref:flagellar assembly protein FliH n=1 Tax=Marinobacter TaxID=2742 RepID=UPI000C6931E2|nr:flagellar assembly protein FliH [Marinobacter sp.]MAO14994.1 flagellar assembly protein FliH [Marinobacter sp.]WBU42706.1 flagellar assembly protein FliH [Marinobacter alkaliphilus]|tara:strand:+ start:17 stop:907 length:891 start_codon:yes stop_codon:yes gene_type:complete
MKDSDQDTKRIPKEQLTAWERWELPLLDERGNQVVQEQEVKPLTAGDLEEIRQAAREDGFQEGREAGYQDGFEKGRADGHQQGLQAGEAEGREQGQQQAEEATRKEVESRVDRLEHLLGELLLPIQRHEEELESVLVNLTTVLARAVVYRELSLDSSQIRHVVRKALAALPSTADNLRIHIHPDDLEPVREVAERLEVSPSIIEDDTLMPGGCKVESRHSLVDYTVEKRFQRAVQGMLEEQLSNHAGAEDEELGSIMGDRSDFHRDVLSESDMTSPETDLQNAAPEQGEDDDLPPG